MRRKNSLFSLYVKYPIYRSVRMICMFWFVFMNRYLKLYRSANYNGPGPLKMSHYYQIAFLEFQELASWLLYHHVNDMGKMVWHLHYIKIIKQHWIINTFSTRNLNSASAISL